MAGTYAIVLADFNGLIQHWSSGAEELLGYSSEEALGQSLDLIVPPEFRERHWAGFRNAVATKTCKLDRGTTNVPVRCKDGAYEIVQDLAIDDFSRERMDATEAELREERAAIEELL